MFPAASPSRPSPKSHSQELSKSIAKKRFSATEPQCEQLSNITRASEGGRYNTPIRPTINAKTSGLRQVQIDDASDDLSIGSSDESQKQEETKTMQRTMSCERLEKGHTRACKQNVL